MENRYNLIEEHWIPVVGHGLVSLRHIFTNSDFSTLGGNPVQKIAIMKLLLAIAQAAVKPKDEDELKQLGVEGLCNKCLTYLDEWHHKFFLFGRQPFLQIPGINAARIQEFGALLPEVSTGNTTVLSQVQVQRPYDDAQKALLIITLMGFALGGKKTDNSIVLSPEYKGKVNDKGKPSTSRPGPSVAFKGLLHSFLLGNNLHTSIWLNILTMEQIEQTKMFNQGIGIPPWEEMPSGEDCPVAKKLKQSLMGRLIPLCRFCLLSNDGIHYSEGLAHADYKDGISDPSSAVNYSGKEPKALWVNAEKRPWRELTALLGFIDENTNYGFQSLQVRNGINRARDSIKYFYVWSGGLSVSSNAGEQYASGIDDFVESTVGLHCDMLGEQWFSQLKLEMSELDSLAKNLYGRVMMFFKEQNVDGGKLAARASGIFWQLCERDFQQLVDSCDLDEESKVKRRKLRSRFAAYVQQVYDSTCQKESARQLDAWAKCRPNNSKYLMQEA